MKSNKVPAKCEKKNQEVKLWNDNNFFFIIIS